MRNHSRSLLSFGVLLFGLTVIAQTQDITPLEPGTPVTRTAKARDEHTYKLTLKAGQFIRVLVEQNELDVVVELFAPDSKSVQWVNFTRHFGTESLSWEVATDGTYKLVIRTLTTNRSEGSYQVQLEVGGNASAQHKQRIVAERLLRESLPRGQSTLPLVQRVEKFQQAIRIWRELADKSWEAITLDLQGIAYSQNQKYEEAIESLNQALAIRHEIQDHLGEINTLNGLAFYSRLNSRNTQQLSADNLAQSLKFLEQAVSISRAIKHRGAERITLLSQQNHYSSLNFLEKGVECYEQVLVIDRENKNRRDEALTLKLIGGANHALQRTEVGQRNYEQALTIFRELNDRINEANTLSTISGVYLRSRQYDFALRRCEQALTIFRELKDRSNEATTLTLMGSIYFRMDNAEKASLSHEQAIVIRRELGDRRGEGWAYYTIGNSFYYLGRYEKTIEHLEKSLPITREIKDSQFEAQVLGNLGVTYGNLSNHLKQIEYLEQTLAIFRRIKHKSNEGIALGALGSAYLELKDYQKAAEYTEQSLAILRTQPGGNISFIGDGLNNLGRIQFEQAQYEKAIEYFDQALAILSVHNGDTRPYTLAWLGNAWRMLGQVDKAIPYHLEGLRTARAANSRHNEAIVLNSLQIDWKAKNQPQLAIFFGKQSVNLLQEMRSGFRALDQDSQRNFLRTNEQTYRELADLLIAQGRLPEAEQVIRMLKEEEYFEYVRRDKDNSPKGEKAALTPEEAAIEKRYREIADQLTILGTERGELLGKPARTTVEEQRLAKLDADLTVANQAFQKFLDGLANEMAKTKGGDTQFVKVRDAQGLMEDLRDLGKGTVALYTLVGEHKFRMILTTPDVQKAYEVPIKGAELNRKVLAFRAVLQNPKLDPRPAAEELYKILFAPLAKDLEQMKAKTLMWSLDGVLRYVPIAALYDGKQYLVERFQHVMFTNESKARLKDEVSKNWRALGLGVTKSFGANIPALPAVAEEMRSIIKEDASGKGVLPGTIKLDEQFTLESMQTGLRQRNQVVHVASHFQFQPGNEMDSALLLGDGKFLSLAQIKVMSTPFSGVELLTLSACNTATSGSGANGKEVEGFGMLAQRQGAKAVVASLWPVADRTTRLLMEEFYRGREANKLTKGEALRHAQAKLLRGELTKQASETIASREIKHDASATSAPPFTPDAKRPHAHPYYWAPFILIGNWK